ncbi:DUF748 domain-containing protein [Pseudomonas cremoricolorata]|uniref:Membrane biogenesis protein n=1 Tax=Pseudomonas cremoricolorata TaxID=157783 RepID=A0A089Y8M7_9PSED|nr:DUF748 domain-containing protein [Pseudomonas cremoricolorata]AIR88188.1 hypothetical protein LK03_02550 [Pseudomonas cremoricolorata]
MLKGLFRALCALVALVALYSLLGFLVLPGIALRVANQQLTQYANAPAHLQRIEFNPFSLELTLWGLEIGEPGKPQVGFERLYANLQLDSLWKRTLRLQAVELDKPRTELLFAKNGQLNLTQLFTLPPSEATPQQPPSDPFPLRIASLTLNEGYLHFRDLRPSEPIEFLYDSMNLELKNLSTLANDNADMTLVAKSPAGGRIDWAGSLSLAPIASEGTLKITDAKMKLWWPYVRDALPLVLQDGMMSFDTHYRLNLAKDTELLLDKTSLNVAPFAIKAPDGRQLARLASLQVSDASLDLAKQRVVIGKIRSQKLETWAALERDGQLDWQVLFASQPKTPSAKDKAAPATAAPKARPKADAAPGKPWQVLLKDVQTRNAMIHLADRSQKEPVTLDLGPLNLNMTGYDSLNRSPFDLKLDTGVGKQGKLQASGQVNLAPVSAKLDINTQDIDLRIAQAYINPYILLELRSGMLTSQLKLDLQGTEPLALSVTGKAQVDQLHTLDTIKNRDLVKWQRVDADGIRYVHGDAVSIDKLTLTQPYARFIINEDRTTNIDDLVIAQPANGPAAAPAGGKTPSNERPLGIRIGQIAIVDGSANFADLTLTPNFATAAQQLSGNVGTIDNRQPTPAKVDIQGKVDRYAPVIIHGALNPFNFMESLDIAASFRRVELTTLTPYSGKFAGYRIRKGRLNLDLHYLISNGQLKAENTVLVEQLQLGDRVESPDALNLPVRLAVALLKDTQGRISLELPVSGDLNNPQFSVMPIVWQTLRNLVLRAAQSPFKFIGGLVSGGHSQDLSTVSFAPGSSELSAESRSALDTLATGLKQRPQLRLEIEGTSAQSSDGPLLAQQRLDREYQATWYKILQRRGDKVPANASMIAVAEDDKPAMLEGIYRTRLKQQPPAEWEQLSREERTRNLRDAVLKYWTESAALQRQLGQDRASSIKDYLVDKGGLADDRVYFIDTTLGKAEKDGKVITPLHLDAG